MVLLALWVALGTWVVMKAPFGSGTDESISYVAFAAAKNRWATQADFVRYGIDHFYYPPLYYLAFAPFWGDDPAFTDNYPRGESLDPNYISGAGRRVNTGSFSSRVPPSLEQLYRAAKLFSLALGLVVLLALVATLRLLFPGPAGWWIALLGTTPLVLLPQFIYYHSLVNNDTLLNALAALSCLAFVAAVLALERGKDRRFFRLSLATAACIGLAFLTKMSAPVLLPLLPGLAWARFRADRGFTVKVRLVRSASLLVILAIAVFACGGWWIAYKAGLGDWSSFEAHRLAHPWAMTDPSVLTPPAWWLKQILRIVRSYYALFAGALLINAPDVVILAWSALPLSVCGCAIAVVVNHVGRTARTRTVRTALDLRRVVWVTFAGVFLLNIFSVLANLLIVMAPYGRLLFPSLVASHVLAAAVVARALGTSPRALFAVTLLLVIHGAVLFGMTFHNPMAAAITQPPEDVRILTGTDAALSYGPVWSGPAEQPLLLPPGEITALRIQIDRSSLIPQLGAALEGTLTLRPATAPPDRVAVRRTALGDNDTSIRWVELKLERSVPLGGVTPAFLTLRGAPPGWLPGFITYSYACGEGGAAAHFKGEDFKCSLRIAAVYRVGGGTAPPATAAEERR